MRPQVLVDFTGGTLSSDGGVLLLHQNDAGLGLSRSLAQCFRDGRDQHFVGRLVPQLVAQRLHGLALGYEDLNDHDQLRRDPRLATACNKHDALGQDRFHPADRGIALAGSATLNRLGVVEEQRHAVPHAAARSGRGPNLPAAHGGTSIGVAERQVMINPWRHFSLRRLLRLRFQCPGCSTSRGQRMPGQPFPELVLQRVYAVRQRWHLLAGGKMVLKRGF